MEGLAPSLRVVLEVRFALENGESVRTGLMRAMSGHHDSFTRILQRWLFAWDQGRAEGLEFPQLTIHQRHLVLLFGHGLRGNPIGKPLMDLEFEIKQACGTQIDNFVRLLPFQMAVPVLLFQFPAFLLLLIGPLMTELMRGWM